jgi:acyl-coenzyme A synthetase/AMP-(fatty) acid ligase
MDDWYERILFHTRERSETPAMVLEDRVVTYGMLGVAIERCARRLAATPGLAQEDAVAVLVANPIRHLVLCLALFRIGVVSVSLEHGQAGVGALGFGLVVGDQHARSVLAPGCRLVEATDDWFALDGPPVALPAGFKDAGQTCRLSLTSGSTGAPKVIPHTVRELGWRCRGFVDLNWRIALCMPGLSSNWGFVIAYVGLAFGKTLCFADSPFQALRMIDLFGVDYVAASTEQLLALARTARKTGAHLASLRMIEVGGGMVTRALMEAATVHLCKDIWCRYGASETGLIARAPAREVLSRPGLVGVPEPGVTVGVFGDDGQPCAAGQVGDLKIRSGPAASAGAWTDLGDRGRVDEDGRLYVIGRAAEAGATGTMVAAISPVHELEHLVRLEWDLADAAAVVVAGAAGGDAPQIWIGVVGQRGATAEAIEAIARARGFDHPVRLIDLPAIPRGTNGKVNRAQLHAVMATRARGVVMSVSIPSSPASSG